METSSGRPYEETLVIGGANLRTFNKTLDEYSLVWHRDREDRFVEVISGNGWALQMDDQLPMPLEEGKEYFIPCYEYHRLLKGNDTLVLKIKKLTKDK